MTEPYDDDWGEEARRSDDEIAWNNAVIADADFAPQLPLYWANCYCDGGKKTLHAGFCDDHGCEVGSGCLKCRRIVDFRGCAYMKATERQEVIRAHRKTA